MQRVAMRPHDFMRPFDLRPMIALRSGDKNALDYARQRMGYGRCDLQVLDEDWNVVETIGNEGFEAGYLTQGRHTA